MIRGLVGLALFPACRPEADEGDATHACADGFYRASDGTCAPDPEEEPRGDTACGDDSGCPDTDADTDTDTDADADTDADTDADADTDSDWDPALAAYIDVTEAPIGDVTCATEGWETEEEEADLALQGEAEVVSRVEDFESGDDVGEATVEIYFSDDSTAEADLTLISDQFGAFEGGPVPTCTPVSFLVYTDPAEAATKDTLTLHQVWAPAEGDAVEEVFWSVSSTTYQVIPSLLGVSPDWDKGIVMGRALDCDGTPLEYAQVVVRDGSDIPSSQVVKYFIDEFPNRSQPHTSEDGLWVVINAPPGEWDLEMWVSDGDGGFDHIGTTPIVVFEDAFTTAEVKAGDGDGVFVPDSCL